MNKPHCLFCGSPENVLLVDLDEGWHELCLRCAEEIEALVISPLPDVGSSLPQDASEA